MAADSASPLHVLCLRTGGIGDVVLSTPALAMLYALDRTVKVVWASYSPKLELVAAAYPAVLPVAMDPNASYAENLRRLKAPLDRIDLVLDLQRSARTMILGKRLARHFNAPYVTWNKGSLRRTALVLRAWCTPRFWFRPALQDNPLPRHALMADCVQRGLKQAGIETALLTPALPASPAPTASLPPHPGGWLAVCAGGLHAGKWAPPKLVATALTTVLERLPHPPGLVFLGDAHDRIPARRVQALLPAGIRLEDRCGEQRLTHAAETLRGCTAVLSNDTALAHLAEAVGTPVAMLFGPTVESFGYAPFLEESKAFSAPVGCRPCTKGGQTNCRFGDWKCYALLEPAPIATQLIHLMQRREA